jgi:hypothetical protein
MIPQFVPFPFRFYSDSFGHFIQAGVLAERAPQLFTVRTPDLPPAHLRECVGNDFLIWFSVLGSLAYAYST